MNATFDRYLADLRKTPLDEKTEHTDRRALEGLLGDFARQAGPDITVQHEPPRVAGKGAPDFKVTKPGYILGYVENKTIGINLDQTLKSEQIKKYRSLSGNILLTDYLQFVWLDEKGVRAREVLCFPTDVETPKFKLRDDRIEAVSKVLTGFFSEPPQGIRRAQDLALALATRSQLLRDFLGEELARQEKDHVEGRLYGLYQIFKAQVFHDLTLAEFADAFAQMLAYGLFLAKLNSENEAITLNNARQFVPGSFTLIRELVQFVEDLQAKDYQQIRWVVDEILSIVNGLDLAAIHEDLSFRNRKSTTRSLRAKDEDEHRLFERDPFIYFYEDFLGKYDATMKKARGVYYTPPPIVNFIVRAIDDILKDSFGIKSGLADHKRVTVLDFACGTGTFLVEVLEQIFTNIGGADAGKAETVVRDHILKNIYGFEYLLAPYTIAHLKLSQYLADRGHPLRDQDRLQVFLTNTLEPIEPQRNFILPALSQEAEQAQKVKDKPILVITGNPPYSGHSKNKGVWISAAIDGYKFTYEIDDKGQERKLPLGEKNPKWLNDDYVKFIRFAQMKMDAVDEGIVGVITNHSWLDNPTFRGMRQSLIRSFDQIYVLDLHGNAKKKERAPDGSDDQNVFDIEQGVAIALFVKKKGLARGVWRGDWWGKRIDKYQAGAATNKKDVEWQTLKPNTPHYLFLSQDEKTRTGYEQGWKVPDIFPVNNVGIVTARDALTIQFSRDDVKYVTRDFSNLPTETAREKYKLGADAKDWKVELAQNDLKQSGLTAEHIIPIKYRPFDVRYTYYTGKSGGFHCRPRGDVMRHMLKPNLGIVVSRQFAVIGESNFDAVSAVSFTIDFNFFRRGGECLFPLYLYPPAEGARARKKDLFDGADIFLGKERIENIAPEFRQWLDKKYAKHFSPEQVFGYIYAVLHAPNYRSTYAEFLRIDFPRIPFVETQKEFETLSALGWDLAQKHLLKDVPDLKLGAYRAKGDNLVEKPRYSEAEQAVYINATQHFSPVSREVWDFHIGGYQVIDKYLKSRKGRTLSLDEITHIENMVNVLAFTIAQMAKIDTAYQAALPS